MYSAQQRASREKHTSHTRGVRRKQCASHPQETRRATVGRRESHGGYLRLEKQRVLEELSGAGDGMGERLSKAHVEPLAVSMCASRPSRYVSVINDNHLVSLMNFNEAKKTEAPTSTIRFQVVQSLKIKDISSPKCQKEKMTLRFYSFLDDRTIKRG
jgi:hypothetical protein